jgi:c-di-GMP-binding flagellar brake protein YcgR
MPTPFSSRKPIHASRLFSRRPLDVRARLVALHSTGERVIVQARTYDVSRGGAGLMLTHGLPSGTEVALCLRLPGNDGQLFLQAIITRRRGFRVGLQFVHTTTEQRLRLCELCYA